MLLAWWEGLRPSALPSQPVSRPQTGLWWEQPASPWHTVALDKLWNPSGDGQCLREMARSPLKRRCPYGPRRAELSCDLWEGSQQPRETLLARRPGTLGKRGLQLPLVGRGTVSCSSSGLLILCTLRGSCQHLGAQGDACPRSGPLTMPCWPVPPHTPPQSLQQGACCSAAPRALGPAWPSPDSPHCCPGRAGPACTGSLLMHLPWPPDCEAGPRPEPSSGLAPAGHGGAFRK